MIPILTVTGYGDPFYALCPWAILSTAISTLTIAMTTKGPRPKPRPSRRTRHSKDDSDIYAALNDFTDGAPISLAFSDSLAIEAMPSELVRQFTLLREVDAKYSGTSLPVS